MPQLLDLPDETLHEIVVCICNADHRSLFNVTTVNKRLSSIATPLIVRVWKSVYDEDIIAFCLHLYRFPYYRRHVRELEFQSFTTWKDREEISNRNSKISVEHLEELATAAEVTCPELASSTNWVDQIRAGVDDALVPLLLIWSPNLTHLGLTIPYYDDFGPYPLLTMVWVSQVARQARSTADSTVSGGRPLMELRHLSISHWDTENTTSVRYAAPFFYLPNIVSFHGFLLGSYGLSSSSHDDLPLAAQQGRYITKFPAGTSSVKEMCLDWTDMTFEDISYLLKSCRNLEKLSWRLAPVLENEEMSPSGLASLFMHHANSLKELRLYWSDASSNQILEDSDDGSKVLQDCFRHLQGLEKLYAPWSLLLRNFQESADNSVGANDSLCEIPLSLQTLGIEGVHVYEITRTGEKIRYLPLDSIEDFLARCGPAKEYPNLKELDLSDGCPSNDRTGFEQLESVAAINGISIIV